jgi:hypothetical protein
MSQDNPEAGLSVPVAAKVALPPCGTCGFDLSVSDNAKTIAAKATMAKPNISLNTG